MKITEFELLEYFSLGLSLEIVSLGELSDFIDRRVSVLDDIPDIYLDLPSAISQGEDAAAKCIGEYFYKERYTPTYSQEQGSDTVFRLLIGHIGAQYRRGELNEAQCCMRLESINTHMNPSSIAEISDLERLYEKYDKGEVDGFEKKVKAQLDRVFALGLKTSDTV